jgi:AcrR family transcriptional regulator
MSLVETTEDQRSPLTPKGEATRARLLRAAEGVFGEVAYDRASVAEITRRAGVANGTFYLYFPSKRAIYGELVRQIGHDLRRYTAETVAGLDKRVEVERRGFQAFFEFVRRHPKMYRIVRQAEFVDRDAFAEYYERFAEGYVEGIEQAMGAGELRKVDPVVLAWCLMGMGDLVGVHWILLGDGQVPDEVIDTMIDVIFGGIESAGGKG